MKKSIDMYRDASDAQQSIVQDFDRLKSRLPEISKDYATAALQVKQAIRMIFGEDACYDRNNFLLQDVLKYRRANCLGLPLLISALLNEFGFNPELALLICPKDKTYELECREFERIKDSTRYDVPDLAEKRKDLPRYRFAPLEHLVLNLGAGVFLETTTAENKAPEGECVIPLTYEQALSFVYKDRALIEFCDGRKEDARELAKKGLELWEKNTQLYSIIAGCTVDEEHEQAVQRFNETCHDNSVDLFDKYLLTKDCRWLDAALEKYPAYAHAISCKAQELTSANPREAKCLFAVASKCYANSTELDLADFYINCAKELAKLFGKEKIMKILRGFRK